MRNKVLFSTQMRVLLGVALLNTFVLLVYNHVFTFFSFDQNLFATRVASLAKTNPLLPVQYCLNWVASIPVTASYFSACCIAVASVLLIIGKCKRFAVILSAIIASVLFLSHAGNKGTWLFEYVMHAAFSFLLVFYYCRSRFGGRVLQQSDFNQTSWFSFIFVTFVFCIVVHFSNIMSLPGSAVGFGSGFYTSVATFFLILLNRIISSQPNSVSEKLPGEFVLLSFTAIVIGVMLLTQVHMDHLLGWFTAPGYKKLITHYDQFSSAPGFLKVFMPVIASHSALFLSLQMVVEGFIAFCLVTRLFQPLASSAAFFLFLSLSVIEFGVRFSSSHWTQQAWVWELLLTAIVMGIIAYHQWREFFARHKKIDILATRPLYPNHSLLQRFWIIVGSVAGLSIVIWLSHNLYYYETNFLIVAGLVLGCELLVMHYIDALRARLHHC